MSRTVTAKIHKGILWKNQYNCHKTNWDGRKGEKGRHPGQDINNVQYKLILIWGFVSLKCKWNFEVKIFHNFSHSFYNFTLLNQTQT